MADNDPIALSWGTYTKAEVAACIEWMADRRGKVFFDRVREGQDDAKARTMRLNPPTLPDGTHIHPDYFRLFREQNIAQSVAYENVLAVAAELAAELEERPSP